MALLPAMALLLLVESLAALSLAATTARLRLVGDRRLAVEASLALETAMARARLGADSLLAAWPPATVAPLAAPPVAGWQVTVVAEREGASPVVRLRVAVLRRGANGHPVAARAGTLLLVTGTADTAIVLDNRPRF